jgi:hypothetical protein
MKNELTKSGEQKMDCQICCEKYTTKIRKKFTCQQCKEHFCSKCVVTNFKNLHTKSIFGPYGLTKITCIFCKLPIEPGELRDLLSKRCYKNLMKLELDELFKEECLLLEDTERIIKEQRTIYEINLIRKWMLLDGFEQEAIDNTLQEMGYAIEKENKNQISYCPNCGNFVQNYECIKCRIQLCDKCLNVKKDITHECDEKLIETIKKVNETCRNCPNCKLLIEKDIGGCDQMFCVKCHTTFSWMTGKIATNNDVKHNPHFFEWRRKNNFDERHPNDDPCEGYFLLKCENLEYGEYFKIIQTIFQKSIEQIDEIYERDEFIREQFRIKFLNKKITFYQWKKKFIQHVNTQKRNKETKIILQLCLYCLYYIILLEDGNNQMVQFLFNFTSENVQLIQKNYGKTINYILLPIED